MTAYHGANAERPQRPDAGIAAKLSFLEEASVGCLVTGA
jgi:hypothetical protein